MGILNNWEKNDVGITKQLRINEGMEEKRITVNES